jgi:hypothetical protein
MPDIVDKTLAAIDLAELFIRKVQESLGCCINSCWDLLDNAWDCAFMHACIMLCALLSSYKQTNTISAFCADHRCRLFTTLVSLAC